MRRRCWFVDDALVLLSFVFPPSLRWLALDDDTPTHTYTPTHTPTHPHTPTHTCSRRDGPTIARRYWFIEIEHKFTLKKKEWSTPRMTHELTRNDCNSCWTWFSSHLFFFLIFLPSFYAVDPQSDEERLTPSSSFSSSFFLVLFFCCFHQIFVVFCFYFSLTGSLLFFYGQRFTGFRVYGTGLP